MIYKKPPPTFLVDETDVEKLIITMTLTRTCLLKKVLLLPQIRYLIGIKKSRSKITWMKRKQ